MECQDSSVEGIEAPENLGNFARSSSVPGNSSQTNETRGHDGGELDDKFDEFSQDEGEGKGEEYGEKKIDEKGEGDGKCDSEGESDKSAHEKILRDTGN